MNVLLISEDKLKSYTSLNDNVFGKVIFPAIKTAQDIYLQEIIGTSLLVKLQTLIKENHIKDQANADYKKLLDEFISPYLIYQTLVGLVPEVANKIVNLGVVQNNDEHTSNTYQGERELVRGQYQTYADAYCNLLQRYLCSNKASYPELAESGQAINPTLDSSATCSLWLGGKRRIYSPNNDHKKQ